jgi:hypothetical protein
MTLFASGGPPKPSINRPPTSAVGRATAESANAPDKATKARKVCKHLMFAIVGEAGASFQLSIAVLRAAQAASLLVSSAHEKQAWERFSYR